MVVRKGQVLSMCSEHRVCAVHGINLFPPTSHGCHSQCGNLTAPLATASPYQGVLLAKLPLVGRASVSMAPVLRSFTYANQFCSSQTCSILDLALCTSIYIHTLHSHTFKIPRACNANTLKAEAGGPLGCATTVYLKNPNQNQHPPLNPHGLLPPLKFCFILEKHLSVVSNAGPASTAPLSFPSLWLGFCQHCR